MQHIISSVTRRFRNLSLLSRIRLVICGLGLAICIIIILISLLYYRYSSGEQTLASARRAVRTAAGTFEVNYTNIIEQFVFACGTKEFASDIRSLSNASSDAVRLVQNELTTLSHCNYLVHSAMILSGDGNKACTLYSSSLQRATDELFDLRDLETVNGITLLPRRPSPLRSSVSVIPLIFPLSINAEEYAQLTLDGSTPDVYVILYLDCGKLEESLLLNGSGQTSGVFYLMNQSNIALNADDSSEHPRLLGSNDTAAFLNTLRESTQDESFASRPGSWLIARKITDTNLILLNLVPRGSLANVLGTAGASLVLIFLVVLVIFFAISLLMTSTITRPVNRLMEVVHQIEENRYTQRIEFQTNDEIGKLNQAINRMYDTIQQQMVRIKEEESEKYLTQIKLLTEQINPHFLYNTLECIQSEVLRGDSQTASSMIQYLAEYLRIGLSYGADLITVTNELRHANAYIKLMNQRFGQSIIFMYQIGPGLNQHLILKTILQPLVENSIRHGFGIDAPGIPILDPTIQVNFSSSEEVLTIEVIDNGSGFDVEEAEKILYASDPEALQHVGLHNVYHRLITYYGKDAVEMTLGSIPYYRNTVTIRIPMAVPARAESR